ncbi:hypothetical protein IZU27_03385 [Treponema socranskii]|uniref:DUF6675 family protein n=1 Tax=Treponema socranskii TaxID=53419 RepID=UPI003D8A46A9
MKKTVSISFFCAVLCAFSAFALPFNDKLSQAERADLESGKVIVRNISRASNMCLEASGESAQKIIRDINDLNPSYLAEVIQVKPYAGNEDLPARLEDTLMNISDYVGIPYYSERHERYYDLYSEAKIKDNFIGDDGLTRKVKADLTMEPFGIIETSISISSGADFVYYVSTNDNTLVYEERFKCAKPKNMKSAILLFRDGDNWILYGAGGVKAMKIIFFEKRIETSFINRIKTFCNFIFEKL